jgi:hypothetical protein
VNVSDASTTTANATQVADSTAVNSYDQQLLSC